MTNVPFWGTFFPNAANERQTPSVPRRVGWWGWEGGSGGEGIPTCPFDILHFLVKERSEPSKSITFCRERKRNISDKIRTRRMRRKSKDKVPPPPEQATKAQGVSKCIALLFL